MNKLGKIKVPKINQAQKDILREYYENWTPDTTIDLKFRFVKILCLDTRNRKIKWLSLHSYVNKRRINYHILSNSLVQLINEDFLPIRVFHSVSEWLAPNEIYREPISNWLINSGIFPFENDDSLDISIQTAKSVFNELEGEKHIIFSGNKSIHIWWTDFNWQNYVKVPEDEAYSKSTKREKIDRNARKIAFHQIQSKIKNTLDFRNAVDTRRVVPIINTVNAYTGRIVTKFDYQDLVKLTDKDILTHSNLRNWNN